MLLEIENNKFSSVQCVNAELYTQRQILMVTTSWPDVDLTGYMFQMYICPCMLLLPYTHNVIFKFVKISNDIVCNVLHVILCHWRNRMIHWHNTLTCSVALSWTKAVFISVTVTESVPNSAPVEDECIKVIQALSEIYNQRIVWIFLGQYYSHCQRLFSKLHVRSRLKYDQPMNYTYHTAKPLPIAQHSFSISHDDGISYYNDNAFNVHTLNMEHSVTLRAHQYWGLWATSVVLAYDGLGFNTQFHYLLANQICLNYLMPKSNQEINDDSESLRKWQLPGMM
jgi:hypothetical protein